jgi:hypothetical protein
MPFCQVVTTFLFVSFFIASYFLGAHGGPSGEAAGALCQPGAGRETNPRQESESHESQQLCRYRSRCVILQVSAYCDFKAEKNKVGDYLTRLNCHFFRTFFCPGIAFDPAENLTAIYRTIRKPGSLFT